MDYPFERNATEYTMSYNNTNAEFDIESKAEIEGLRHLHSHECMFSANYVYFSRVPRTTLPLPSNL